jgi:heat shock protein 1/8
MFFATDFIKETEIPLTVETKLRSAIEKTKRTISAFSESSSVESLKNGVDYTGSINRMRFDTVVNAVYLAVASLL